jgi:hypothetical protein
MTVGELMKRDPNLKSLFESNGLRENDSVRLRAGLYFEIEAGGMRQVGIAGTQKNGNTIPVMTPNRLRLLIR